MQCFSNEFNYGTLTERMNSKMKFGNAAWGLRETPLEEQFKITAEMGLDVLEIGIANAPMDIALDVTDAELENIKAMANRYGIKMACAATGNDFTTGTGDIAKVKRVIDICKVLGIGMVRIFAGFTPLAEVTDEMFNTMIDSLKEVCEYAEKEGVTPVIETHGGVDGYDDGVEHIMSTTTDLETIKRIFAALPSNARICYDPANLYAVGVKHPEEFYNEIKDKVAYAHLKDFAPVPSGHIKPSYCGASDMDWKAILRAMSDFDGVALFEYENTEDIEEGLQNCFKYISSI